MLKQSIHIKLPDYYETNQIILGEVKLVARDNRMVRLFNMIFYIQTHPGCTAESWPDGAGECKAMLS